MRTGPVQFDEDITQLDHALQAAALAEADGAPDELIVASLLHDVGHLLLGEQHDVRHRDLEHEKVGAKFLVRRFGPAIAGPIALHVQAKRYLVAVDREYCDRLSRASNHSLTIQGGPLAVEEAERFIELPHARESVALRRWDDRAKVPGTATPELDHWRQPIVRALHNPPVLEERCRPYRR